MWKGYLLLFANSRSIPVFSTKFMTKILYSTVALSLLGGCAIFDKKDTDKESNWLMQQFEKTGDKDAELATVAYSQGDFKKAQELVLESLHDNPRNQQALLVGALNAEKLGRTNRARQYYEDLIVIGGSQKTILGTDNGVPTPIVDIAKKRLRALTIKQSKLVIENPNGSKSFDISKAASKEQSKTAINTAWKKKKPAAKKSSVSNLFTPQEQNIITRFLTLKELAEKDLITKEEFLSRRTANVGGLLPLTHQPAATGIDQPVPSPDLIIERINVLKEATESRAITPQEFSAERDIIIEALLPPNPRTRMARKAPSRTILSAAKDLRKLEVLYDLNLITSSEKTAEQKAIEKYLGINRAPATPKTEAPKADVKPVTEKEAQTTETSEAKTVELQAPVTVTVTVPQAEPASPVQPQPIVEAPVPQVQINTVETVTFPQGLQPVSAAEESTPASIVPAAATNTSVPNVSSPF